MDPQQPIRDLKDNVARDNGQFETLLIQSLKSAREQAEQSLEPSLFEALEWPVTFEQYCQYLENYLRWVPAQSGDPVWQDPNSESQGFHELADRLSHFFWLIGQEVGPDDSTISDHVNWFHGWLIDCSRCWGDFLDTPESFSEEVLQSFIQYAPQYRIEESLINGRPNHPSGWRTFNLFFARELNPGLRPVSSPDDNSVVTCPADSNYKQKFEISADSLIPGATVKRTHRYGDIQKLLEGSRYANAFANGTFVHYCLPPYAYHHFHTPVAGRVQECFQLDGGVYMGVAIKEGRFDSQDRTQSGFEFHQARGVLTLDTAESEYGDLGVVAVIPVGMGHVSSVNMTAMEGSLLRKGDEFGYFLFGGSDIIVLFQEGVAPEIDESSAYRLFGTVMANCQLQ